MPLVREQIYAFHRLKSDFLSRKLIIVCATLEGANLRGFAFKIRALRQKLFIICATRAGANLRVLAAKIIFLCQKFVIICATRAGAN